MANKNRWQAPGNGKIFDAKLGSDSYMNQRTICVLKFIQNNTKISQNKYEMQIKQYLNSCADHKENRSTPSHFFRPLLFLGFIQQYGDSSLELTIEGNKFLEAFEKEDFTKCKYYILNQLDNTRYPNNATKNVSLYIFPFRILFKLLLENNRCGLSSSFMKKQLVHIKNFLDLDLYLKYRDLDYIKSKEPYPKFHTWVINSLVDIGILKKIENNYFIPDELYDYIKNLYQNLDYKDFFYSDKIISCDINNQISKKRYKRDIRLINEAKIRDNYNCQIDQKHITFLSKNKNYVEGHHIIPMYQQKNYDFDLDDKDNIISLCPNCHREIHSADDKNKILGTIYEHNKVYMLKNSISLSDLYKMYMCAF